MKKPTDDYLTKKEFRSILKAELTNHPTREETRTIIREELTGYATKDDLKKFATKEDLERFATKDDLKQLGLDIVDAIERMLTTKADKEQVDKLEARVVRLEHHAKTN